MMKENSKNGLIKFKNEREYLSFLKTNSITPPIFKNLVKGQIFELAKIRNPAAADFELKDLASSLEVKLGEDYGSYFHYNWCNKSIKILEEPEFIELRTSRNLYKINHKELHLLKQSHIVVIGMSVGKAISQIICLERICGKITLIDFDLIETSNLNRIFTPLFNVNENKAEVTAREILEMDPYIQIQVVKEGLTKENIERVLGTSSSTQLVVEVCDNLEIKIETRNYCKNAKIPVIMDTSDRGMVDIERYDIDNNLLIFNGLLEEIELDKIDFNNAEHRFTILSKIVNIEKVSDRAKFSLKEIGKTIRTWPQLASDVFLGAASTTFVARKILLKENIKSGKYYIDLKEIFNQ